MRFYRSGARVCSRTGLVLVPAAGEREFRVASSAYGALNPPVRGPAGSDVFLVPARHVRRSDGVHGVDPGVRVR